MEIVLNLVWASLALSSVCLWFRLERREGAERCLPLIALLMLIVVLFPVISVSDDLWALQNPAEMDTFQRRDQLAMAGTHPANPLLAAVAEPIFSGITFAPLNLNLQTSHRTPDPASPPPARILNRPPPVA